MQRTRQTRLLHRHSSAGSRGFSLLELMIVVSLFMVVAGITFLAIQPALKDARANQAFDRVLMQMRVARQRAIAERKQYIVCFGTPVPLGALTPLSPPTAKSIQIFRWDAGTALSASVQISENQLPTDMQFQVVNGIPNTPTTVPDGFGTGTVAIDFDQGVGGGAIKNQVMFMPDGSARDTAGNLNSGIIYVGRTGDIYSVHAITLYGATGRIRGWRLLNSGGPLWYEQ